VNGLPLIYLPSLLARFSCVHDSHDEPSEILKTKFSRRNMKNEKPRLENIRKIRECIHINHYNCISKTFYGEINVSFELKNS